MPSTTPPKRARIGAVTSRDLADPGRVAAIQDTMALKSAAADRRHGGSRRSVLASAEDTAQEAWLVVLRNLERGTVIHDLEAFVHPVVTAVSRRACNSAPQADQAALSEFNRRIDAFTDFHGRRPTPREEDAIEQSVLADWPRPRHRPSPNFRRTATFESHLASLEALAESFDGGVEAVLAISESAFAGSAATDDDTTPARSSEADAGSDAGPDAGSATESRVSTGWAQRGALASLPSDLDPATAAIAAAEGAVDRRYARSLAYPAFAYALDAPAVRPGTLSDRAARAAKKLLDEQPGGIAGLVERMDPAVDPATDPVAAAFFAPWGREVGAEDRARVVALLRRYQRTDIRETLWLSAKISATTARKPRVRRRSA